ncbi:hypothetical protein ABEF91_004120 [Exophiala dermatitidis]
MRSRRMPHERRHQCTHTTMTRLYDPMGSFTCSSCRKHPSIGWLYRCTQDHDGFLPERDFSSPSNPGKIMEVPLEFGSHFLSPAVVQAIGEGQYTDEQIRILVKQKEKVRETILVAGARPPTASTVTTMSSSSEGTFSILPQSTTFSTTSTTGLDDEIKAAYNWKELQEAWMSEPSMPPADSRLRALPADFGTLSHGAMLPVDQICDLKICHTCRPTYRERAYQSLNHILQSPVQSPPIWELENRRVSDARIVAQIRQPTVPRFYPGTSIQSFESDNGVLEMAIPYINGSGSSQNDSETHSVRKRSGFRETVRKALARARHDDSPPAPNIVLSGSDQNSRSDTSKPSRSFLFRRRKSRVVPSFAEMHGRVVDTSPLQDSVMLMLASNTPLPDTPTTKKHQLTRITEDTEQSLEQTGAGNAGWNAEIIVQS